MDDNKAFERLKSSCITLAEDYKMVKRRLPKALSVNNSTGLVYTLAVFAGALFVILNTIIGMYGEEAFTDNSLMCDYTLLLQYLPVDANSIGAALISVGVVVALTVLTSVLMRLRPAAKIKDEDEYSVPDDEEELFKKIHYYCAVIPDECGKLDRLRLYMTIGPLVAVFAAFAAAVAMTAVFEASVIVRAVLTAGALYVIYLVIGLILRAITFAKMKIIDVETISTSIREYENTLRRTRSGIKAIEEAMAEMAAGNADEAIRKIRYSASMNNRDGEAAAVAVAAMGETEPSRMENNYKHLLQVIGEGIQNKDVERFCVNTANALQGKVAELKKKRTEQAMEKYTQALQLVETKSDYNSAILLCEDACYEGISGALLLDLYCRLAQTLSRMEESFVLQSIETLRKRDDLSDREKAIFAAILDIVDPYIQRKFSITGNKTIASAVVTSVKDIVTKDSIEKSVASAKKAWKNGDISSALMFFNIAAGYKSVEAMSAYLAVSLLRDLGAGKNFTDEEIKNKIGTMEKTLRLKFSDKELEALCREAYDKAVAYTKAPAEENRGESAADAAKRKKYMADIATALNAYVNANRKSDFEELFDFLMNN